MSTKRRQNREKQRSDIYLQDLINDYFEFKNKQMIVIEDQIHFFPLAIYEDPEDGEEMVSLITIDSKTEHLCALWKYHVNKIFKSNKSRPANKKQYEPEINALHNYIKDDIYRNRRDVWIRHALIRCDYYGLEEYNEHDLSEMYDPDMEAEEVILGLVCDITPFRHPELVSGSPKQSIKTNLRIVK